MKVNITLDNGAKAPTRGSVDAACWDLYSIDSCYNIEPGQTMLIRTGIRMEIPKGFVGLIYPRSGNAVKRNLSLINATGVIDADYRGEVCIPLHNYGKEAQVISANERLGQIMIMPFPEVEYDVVDELSDTVRGEGGFGSSGIK